MPNVINTVNESKSDMKENSNKSITNALDDLKISKSLPPPRPPPPTKTLTKHTVNQNFDKSCDDSINSEKPYVFTENHGVPNITQNSAISSQFTGEFLI